MSQRLQKASYRNPNGLRADSPGSPGRGMGTGKGKGFSFSKSRERDEIWEVEPSRPEREAWAAKHLPGENHYVVTTARIRLANSNQPVNAETVREWLRGRGWLKEQR
jgi:hypothetical protein